MPLNRPLNFNVFRIKCKSLLIRSGDFDNGITVEFSNDDGKYVAEFSNGVKIKGNSASRKVGIYWGSGHCAIAAI